MVVYQETLNFSTKGEVDFINLTEKVSSVVHRSGVKNGLVHVFAPHATGIIILTESEEGLLEDIAAHLERIAPRSAGYNHPSNAHSHLRSALIGASRTAPVIDGELTLGTWQSIFFVETDVYPRQRTVIAQVMGE